MSEYSAAAQPQNFNQTTAFAAALQRAKQVSSTSKRRVRKRGIFFNSKHHCLLNM